MTAKPMGAPSVEQISVWKIREKRKQEAKAKDKSTIKWYVARVEQLEN